MENQGRYYNTGAFILLPRSYFIIYITPLSAPSGYQCKQLVYNYHSTRTTMPNRSSLHNT